MRILIMKLKIPVIVNSSTSVSTVFVIPKIFIFALCFLEVLCLSKEAYGIIKCDACVHVVDKFKIRLSEISPTRKVEGIGYKIDRFGERVKVQIPERHSEIHITDMMDTFCDELGEYAFGTSKVTKERRLIQFVDSKGKMNPELQDYDVEDLGSNQLIPDYCREFLSDYDDDLMEYLKNDLSFESLKFCQDVADLCNTKKTEDKTEL